jgi:hypothetical protein
VEEFFFVPSLVRRFGSVLQVLVIPASFLMASGSLRQLSAQTAPQLVPYTARLVAGGAASTPAAGATCPVSGNTSTDAYGDGCLATEVQLSSPRYAVEDSAGNIFFSDYTKSLIRRIDAVTGIVTLVAGGPSTSPTTGASCGTAVSLDNKGDGCLATAVNLFEPVDLKFAVNGDLYFVETGNADVRKITATNGLITTTGTISLVAGNVALKTSGYATNQGGTAPISVGPGSTNSLLDFPASLAFDNLGNLYIADEGNEALEVVNTTAASETIQGVTIPAGTIAKIAGWGVYQTKSPTGECPNGVFVSSTNRGGCYFGTYSNTQATPAVNAQLDAPYAIALDPAGNVYFDNEFIQGVGKIAAGSLTNYAGINGSYAAYSSSKPLPRAAAGSFAIGSNFGLAVDANSNMYVSDALNGVVWRVDSTTKTMYAVAGSFVGNTTAGASCPVTSTSTATDTYGDGCPAAEATFGKSGTSFSSSGIYGVSVDANSNLFIGDSATNLVREVSSGTSFGNVGADQTTQTLDIHFGAGDSPAANAYILMTGSGIFSLGSASCKANSDNTTDCLLPLTAAPTVLGPFAGTLKITSTQGGVATFPLSGNYVKTPFTRTALSSTAGASCSGNVSYVAGSSVVLTATVTSSGTATGTVTFSANGTTVGTPQPLTNNVATLSYSFPTAGTYVITAKYSGDSYYAVSSTSSSLTVVAPSFTAAATTNQQSTVVAGQTALYGFNLASTYAGSITFSCSGLPANSSCSFSPVTITPISCSATNTVALSIFTHGPGAIATSSIASGGRGLWQILCIAIGLGSALLFGLGRRRLLMRHGQLWMVIALLLASSGLLACGKSSTVSSPTPAGSYTVTVTATGSTGTLSSFTVPLVIH